MRKWHRNYTSTGYADIYFFIVKSIVDHHADRTDEHAEREREKQLIEKCTIKKSIPAKSNREYEEWYLDSQEVQPLPPVSRVDTRKKDNKKEKRVDIKGRTAEISGKCLPDVCCQQARDNKPYHTETDDETGAGEAHKYHQA